MHPDSNHSPRAALLWGLLGPSCPASFLLTLAAHCSNPWLPDIPQSPEGKHGKPRAATAVPAPPPSTCFTHVLPERPKTHQTSVFYNRTTNLWEMPHRKHKKLKKIMRVVRAALIR